MPTQLQLPRLADPRYKRPLCAIETAKGLLDLTEDEVGELVDEGALVAFDIKCPSCDRRELRVLTASIAHYSHTSHTSHSEYVSPFPPDQAINFVLSAVKHDKPYITGKEIKRLLNCGRQHVINLVESKSLPLVPGTTYRQGPNGFPLIPRDKFTAWLSQRLEGGV